MTLSKIKGLTVGSSTYFRDMVLKSSTSCWHHYDPLLAFGRVKAIKYMWQVIMTILYKETKANNPKCTQTGGYLVFGERPEDVPWFLLQFQFHGLVSQISHGTSSFKAKHSAGGRKRINIKFELNWISAETLIIFFLSAFQLKVDLIWKKEKKSFVYFPPHFGGKTGSCKQFSQIEWAVCMWAHRKAVRDNNKGVTSPHERKRFSTFYWHKNVLYPAYNLI